MMKRRGLVSKSAPEPKSPHAAGTKRERAESDLESMLSSSESSGFSSSLSDVEDNQTKTHDIANSNTGDVVNGTEIGTDAQSSDLRASGDNKAAEGPKGKKKQKPDYTDETKWQKVKLKGSEKEVMIDKSRLQTYVDFDSAGVTSFQNEVKQAQGNFRQQALADYSDL